MAICESRGKKAHEFVARSPMERVLLAFRDSLRTFEFRRLVNSHDLLGFDIYHFHGGIGFFRDARWARRLAQMGKTIICNYHGPDLRSRGVIPEIDRISHLNITNEFDLIDFHPDLHYIPIPYEPGDIKPRMPPDSPLRIIHTPSVPARKGTHIIEPVLRRIASERRVEVVILTGVSRQRVIEEKQRSHIAVEQIGNLGGTGYGVNSLEALALGMPTVTEFTPEYERFLQGHPFVLANEQTLYTVLNRLINSQDLRRSIGLRGQQWLKEHHGFANVWRVLLSYLRERRPAVAEQLASLSTEVD